MSQPTPPEEQRPAETPAPEETNEENTKEKKRKPGAFAADVYGWFQALAFALALLADTTIPHPPAASSAWTATPWTPR